MLPLLLFDMREKKTFFYSPRTEADSYQQNKDFSVYLSTRPDGCMKATGDFKWIEWKNMQNSISELKK